VPSPGDGLKPKTGSGRCLDRGFRGFHGWASQEWRIPSRSSRHLAWVLRSAGHSLPIRVLCEIRGSNRLFEVEPSNLGLRGVSPSSLQKRHPVRTKTPQPTPVAFVVQEPDMSHQGCGSQPPHQNSPSHSLPRRDEHLAQSLRGGWSLLSVAHCPSAASRGSVEEERNRSVTCGIYHARLIVSGCSAKNSAKSGVTLWITGSIGHSSPFGVCMTLRGIRSNTRSPLSAS